VYWIVEGRIVGESAMKMFMKVFALVIAPLVHGTIIGFQGNKEVYHERVL
jgi:hypothetical protein